MRGSPSSRFSKPVLGRVVLAATGQRAEYIDVARREDGTLRYVLNVWREPDRPRVVGEDEVAEVEPFGRPAC